ncbi:MAG: tRNA modification GTPase [Thermoguttaceae bacterium]|nr:tRNA modification GTPase [Thermoguttaceae bacterium]
MYPLEDTICAIASARSKGGLRGIVRLSGPESEEALNALGVCVPEDPGKRAFLFDSEIRLENLGKLPARIYVWRGGKSYTGQNAAEIHTHGVLPFLEKLIAALCETGHARLAQPGEFTLRAFLSGRLDLTQAEAVLGTIDAQNPKKLNAALHQLAGGLAHPLHDLRARLFDLLGHLEAGFDFADEDIEFISSEEIARGLRDCAGVVSGILAKMRSRGGGEILARAVLYGSPNIGKSALFNALTGTENALVFDRPGTTRDYLCATLSLGDFTCQLVDTAGDFDSDAQEIGVLNERSQELARTQRELADVPLYCFDAAEFVQSRPEALRRLREKISGDAVVILTRCDLLSPEKREVFQKSFPEKWRLLWTSAKTREGVDALKTRLGQILEERANDESDVVGATQTRCRASLQTALESLERAEMLCGTEFQELIATEIRTALDQIGLMVGAIYTEDLLDSIFSRFCVGK